MKQLVTLLFLFFTSTLFAQDSIAVLIKVVDDKNLEEIANVNITFKQGKDISYYHTSRNGLAKITAYKGSDVELLFAHPQLESKIEKLTGNKLIGDTLFLTVKMQFVKIQNIEGVVVAAPGTPVIVYQSQRLHVEDFELLPSGDVVLLTYPKRLAKGSELVLFDGIKVVQSFQVPDKAQELVHDFRGNVHVLCESNVFGIHPAGSTLGVSALPKDYFMKYVAPIIDTNRSKMYFSNFNKDYPAFDYFAFDQLDSTYSKLLSIEDELMMELYRSEYKYVDVRTKICARTKEMETGIDAEVWVGANYFTQSRYYKELYAPLFHRNDSLFIFDYYKDSLFTYSVSGQRLKAIPVYHHYRKKQTGWSSELLQDKVTGEIYALFDRHGYTFIGRVDLNTGEINEQVSLKHRFISKVQVFNNEVYYVYRPFESMQKKYLYKEKLPYTFSKQSVHAAQLSE